MTQVAEERASVNIASHLAAMAKRSGTKDALILTKRVGAELRATHITFAELDREVDRVAHGLERIGIERGMRTVVLVPPGREFFELTFALFKLGAIVVLIDPGMGRKNVLRCLEETEPEAMIGIPVAHAARTLLRALRTVKIRVTVGRRWFWGGYRYQDLKSGEAKPYVAAETRPTDPAAILFTTGSTGLPKGALYEHGMFDAQVKAIAARFQFGADEIDLPTFPLFALFDPALGMTAVIPDMDFTKPAKVDPRNVIEPIQRFGATNMFGSPALLDTVGRFGEKREKLPTLRRVLSAGAPVPPAVLERFHAMLGPEVDVFTPYGATESLPVAVIGSREILAETRHETLKGGGTCVGLPTGEIEVKLIAISDEPIAEWSESLVVPQGTIGEICVKGPVVTKQYWARPEQTALAKIRDGDAVWHRMGDLGRQDERGRIWFQGRKGHRVVTEKGTLFTDPVEAIIGANEWTRRCALVGVGNAPRQRPVVVLESDLGRVRVDPAVTSPAQLRARLIERARELAAANPLTASIDTFLIYPGELPVDIRHNAKIFREKLAVWAAEQLA